jgi:hypothetical protein
MGWSGWEGYLTQNTDVDTGYECFFADPTFTYEATGVSINTPWEVDVPYFNDASGDDDTFHAKGGQGGYETLVSQLNVEADGRGDFLLEVSFLNEPDGFTVSW